MKNEEKDIILSDEEIDREFREMIPEDLLTKDERKYASDIAEQGYGNVIKYIKTLHPDLGLKEAKIYYDLYIKK